MKIVIVGAGSIGRVMGALLGRGGNDITLLDSNPEVVAAINRRGIGFIDHGYEDPDLIAHIPATAVADGTEVKECDAVLLAVKSYDTLPAVKNIARLITGKTPLISLQTGLGNIEVMERIVPRDNIIGAYTYMGGASLGPGDVKLGGKGKTIIGELDGLLSGRVSAISKVFNDCGIDTEISHRIIGRIWSKVLIFAAINPVSAILKVQNGILLDKMESVTLMKRLIDEGREVAEAFSIDLGEDDLYHLLFDICKRTSTNISSMLQDILNGKKTEIDALNGALCRYGREKGVLLPTHHTIVQLVKCLENSDQPGAINTQDFA